MDGSVSRNSDLGPSCHFIKCRSLHFLNAKRLRVFGIKLKIKAQNISGLVWILT